MTKKRNPGQDGDSSTWMTTVDLGQQDHLLRGTQGGDGMQKEPPEPWAGARAGRARRGGGAGSAHAALGSAAVTAEESNPGAGSRD